MMAGLSLTCKNCGSSDLTWDDGVQNLSGVQDGRMKLNEMQAILILGCEQCSETIVVVPVSVITDFLNKHKYELMEEVVRQRG